MSLEIRSYRRRRPMRVDAHVGSISDFRRRLQREQRRITKKLKAKSRLNRNERDELTDEFSRHLMYFADERSLWIAREHLRVKGGDTPGPDGVQIGVGEPSEWFARFRKIRDDLQDGTYVAGLTELVNVPKSSGGYRTIRIANAIDRIIARSISQVLAPFFESRFSEHSYGFRPRRGPAAALADAIRITERQSRWSWLCHDVRNAFDSIPRERLFDLLPTIPREMKQIVERLVDTGMRKGIPQGCPLSPLLMNIYLDHFIDKPWQRQLPKVPLLRYVDDILVLCPGRAASSVAHGLLKSLITDAGLKLKVDFPEADFSLENGERPLWLGYEMTTMNRLLVPRISERAWLKLEIDSLPRAYDRKQIRDAVRSWLAYLGPTYGGYCREERVSIYRRLRGLVARFDVDVEICAKELSSWWRKAWNDFEWRLHRDTVVVSTTPVIQERIATTMQTVANAPF